MYKQHPLTNTISKQGLAFASLNTQELTDLYYSVRKTGQYQFATLHREFIINSLLTDMFGEDVINQAKSEISAITA